MSDTIAKAQADALGASECFSQTEKDPARSACRTHSDALRQYEHTPHALFNDRVITGNDSQRTIKAEQPHHRLMVLMRARGFSTNEIASELGYTASTVSIALRQPWARQLLVDILQKEGLDGVHDLLKAELVPSVLRLVDERDNDEAKPSERISAANSLIDRFLGKPTQRVETAKATLPSDIEALQREYERNQAELTRIKAN